jgi:hypothetical protein
MSKPFEDNFLVPFDCSLLQGIQGMQGKCISKLLPTSFENVNQQLVSGETHGDL